ncbi:MAG: DUF2807 domain-containing protein, partial [Catalinimonas sp.]
MKRQLLFLLCTTLGLATCGGPDPKPCLATDQAQPESYEFNVALQSVRRLVSEVPADVFVTQGSRPSVRVEAAPAVARELACDVEGERLILRSRRCFDGVPWLRVFLTLPTLEAVTLRAGGSVVGGSR